MWVWSYGAYHTPHLNFGSPHATAPLEGFLQFTFQEEQRDALA